MKIIFDLDGTLANCKHRLYWIQREIKDWDSFFARCHEDKPIESAIKLLIRLSEYNRVEIWSCRRADTLAQTSSWLYKHDIPPDLLTHLRPEHNRVEDDLLKKRWLDDLRAVGGDVDIAFEDRQRVVDMWRESGVLCFQGAKGDF